MTRSCSSIVCLVAGGLLCGVPSALPAAQGIIEREPLLFKALATLDSSASSQTSSVEACSVTVAQATVLDTPVAIISDHIRRQGYTCDEPRQAERDRPASRPNLTVWILTCANATYRVTLIPDMAARVERLK